MVELETKSLKKAVIPSTLLENPSPGNIQSTRLALHVNDDDSSCWIYIASGCDIYKLQISLDVSLLSKGKGGLLIPEQTETLLLSTAALIQSIVLAESESGDHVVLGSVDSYGHLIVSKMDATGKDVDRITYSVMPRDIDIGEGSWAGLCFSPSQWSMAAVARNLSRSVDVYDQDIHLRTLRTLWNPNSLNFLDTLGHGNETSILAVTEGCQVSQSITEHNEVVMYLLLQCRWASLSRLVHCSKYEITGLAFSSIDPNYIYIKESTMRWLFS